MACTLDITPLRSFVAVADAGGFQRAAAVLHLTQSAVSQHVRRLEAATGRPLVERQGRGFRFTADGEQLLARGRRMLELHDETLRSLAGNTAETIVIGSTEHAAAQLLPHLTAALQRSGTRCRARFRIDRGTRLRDSFAAGQIDMALLPGPAEDPSAAAVGNLDLTWYSAPGWSPPPEPEPLPLVTFDNPCALRSRALETLAHHGIPVAITAEAAQLAGVHAAVSAGLGVALMATLGQTPAGLVARDDLPGPEPLPLALWTGKSVTPAVSRQVAAALHSLLAARALTPVPPHDLAIAQGA